MNQISVSQLTIQNFKGIASCQISLEGNMVVAGANRVGKTTLMDAYYWCLQGKDSLGQAQFEIFPVGSRAGDASVEVTTNAGTFKRVLKRKKGGGTTTENFFDGTPVKKTDYDAKVSEIMGDPTHFYVLSDPRYCTEKLEWTKVRDLLLEMCDTSQLPDPPLNDGKSLDDHKKRLERAKKNLENELATIPARIQENQNQVNKDLAGMTGEKIKNGIVELQSQLTTKKDELANFRASTMKEVHAVEAEIRKAVEAKEDEAAKAHKEVRRLEADAAEIQYRINGARRLVENLREMWNNVANSEQGNCPTCGQAFPPEKLEEEGNIRAEKLKEIQQEGKKAKAELEKEEKALAEHNKKVEQAREATRGIDTSPPADLVKKRDELRKKAEAMDTSALEAEIAKLEERIAKGQEKWAALNATKQALKRIEELKVEENVANKQMGQVERDLHAIREYVRGKVRVLESQINDRSTMVRWQLFQEQVNGELAECCRLTMGGVPYHSLNSEARINGGLDVINMFANHWGMALPVWVDNAESVNDLLHTVGQQIRLVVSEDQELRVEGGTA